MLLEFQKRMIMAEEWWSPVLKGDCVGNTYFKHRNLYKYTRVARAIWSGGKEHDRSGAGEE